MTDSREPVKMDDLLDELMALHGLSSRYEARRWLIEALDTAKRLKLTEGRRTDRISGDIEQDESGRLITASHGRRIPLANSQRKLIGDDGYTREGATLIEEIPDNTRHIPAPIGFQAALAEREWHRDKRNTGRNSTKASRSIAKVPTKRKLRSDSGKPKRDRPKPGTKGEIIYDELVAHGWNISPVLEKLMDHPEFMSIADKRNRRKNIRAHCCMIEQRYRDRA